MRHFAHIAIAATAAAIIAAMTFTAPAEYAPLLSAAPRTETRIAAADAAGFAGRTAAKRVAGVARRRTAKRKVRVATPKPASRATAPASLTDAARAQVILAGLAAKYPILEGTTVEMGYARGYQAVCYYRSGRIVISPTHTATLERILNHEIWHVIDFRTDGAINWGESLPPANALSFQG